MEGSEGTPLLEARGIVKRYPDVLANDHAGISIREGEVHALLGENGAGKSTLSKVLYGYTRPDEGEILFRGRPVRFGSPQDARKLGIGMVFQSFTLIPALSVTENVALFQPTLKAVTDGREIAKRIREYADRFGLSVNPAAQVRQLSVGQRQKAEILKFLLADSRLLILDEPTKVLAPQETEALFRIFARLKAEGYALLFITHKLREVLACADRITVMRRGRIAGELSAAEADEGKLVGLMFAAEAGGTGDGGAGRPLADGPLGEPVLELSRVSLRRRGQETPLEEIDLRVHPGQIVGVAGVSGNGQKELGDLLLGLHRTGSGVKRLHGENASRWSIARMRASRVGFIPEDPLGMGCVPGMSVRENLFLGTGRSYRRRGGLLVDWRRLEGEMTSSFRRLGFPVPPLHAPAGSLSGGNLQRAIVARETARDPRLLVAMYPTRGLDVRSAEAVRAMLRAARDRGAGILLVSEDLEELFALSGRLLVLFRGRIVKEFSPAAYDTAAVGRAMTGVEGPHGVE
jgi:general nucleoside transport system ATP-binding protein